MKYIHMQICWLESNLSIYTYHCAYIHLRRICVPKDARQIYFDYKNVCYKIFPHQQIYIYIHVCMHVWLVIQTNICCIYTYTCIHKCTYLVAFAFALPSMAATLSSLIRPVLPKLIWLSNLCLFFIYIFYLLPTPTA